MLRSKFYDLEVGTTVWLIGRAKEHGQSAIVSYIGEYEGVKIKFQDGRERSISPRYLSLTPPVEKQKMVEIPVKNLNEILYHLNSFMQLMGFGREYDKIVKTVKELPLKDMDLSEFYYINKIVNPK